MYDQTAFKSLIKPLLVFFGLIALVASFSFGVVVWCGWHGWPHWADKIATWDVRITMALCVGWFIFVLMRMWKAQHHRKCMPQ